nr:putative ribonuclease H-like domain-containing protein [Tanacetum cinerariifolium]
MTDYSLWEVILNGDSPTPTRVVNGVVQAVAPITAEKRLAKKNELKVRRTLLMALPDKHQLMFNIHKDAKSLMETIEKSFPTEWRTQTLISRNKANLEDQSLDDLFNNLKIYDAEVKSSSSPSHTTQNIAFMSFQNTNSTNESVSAVTSVSTASTKPPDSILLNVDNLKEMDLKLQMAMLTMRARRFPQRSGRNLGANGTTSIGFDMSKVECYNYHRRGHFARECSYDWSFQADEEPTNYALMAFTSSSSSDSNSKDIKLLKLNVMLRDNALVELRKKFKKAKKRDKLKLTLENLHTSLKNLCKLLASQITEKTGLGYDNQMFHSTVFDCDELNSYESNVSVPTSPVHDRYKSGEGYHEVPPHYTGTFMPPKPDLVFHDASNVSESVPTVFDVEPSTTKPTKELSQTNRPSAPIIKDWVSDSEDESEVEYPTQAKNLRKATHKSRGHKHSWNRKAYFFCKSLNYLIKDCDYYEQKMVQKPIRNQEMRVNPKHSPRMTPPYSHKHVVPTAVLTRSRLVLLNAARPVTTVVPQTNVKHQRPVNHVVNKAHSPLRRPINHRPSPKNSNFYQKVTTVKAKQVNVVQGAKGNWIQVSHGLSPQKTLTFLFDVEGNPQQALKDKEVIDSGCSRHMTGNIFYLFDFEEINRGYVAFGGNPKGGKITRKGKIKIGKLDFDDVYFVKELTFNLFSVSQMCDKNNSVLFTNTKFVVLSSDFKLPDENHVLLRVPRENNMYNVDLKNIVPLRDLTSLFAKATLDESNLWHKRLCHINFKTMNKMVKGNLVRGLPLKVFENNHTCVACKKGKKHKASCKTKPVSSVSLPLQRVFVTKPHNKTPYELLLGRTPSIGFMRHFGCHATIFNTLDPLGKFDGKADEGFLETLHINFLENQPNVAGSGPTWLFDIDTLTQSMNYQPVVAENQPNSSVGIQEKFNAGKVRKESVSTQQYVLLPLWSTGSKDPQNTDTDAAFDVKKNESEVHVSPSSSVKPKKHDEKATREAKRKSPIELSIGVRDLSDEFEEFSVNSTNRVNAASASVTAVEPNSTNSTNNFNVAGPSDNAVCPTFEIYDEEDIGAEADFSNLETSITVSPIPTTRVHKDHPITQIIVDLSSAPQTKSMARMVKEQGFEDPDYPDKVYKVVKALYGLHQALRAWYETLANYLLENGFQGGKINQTLFIKKQKGLQVKQKDNGIFISQDKYVAKILRKLGLIDGKSATTHIDTEKPLLMDPDGKTIFRYLKGKPHLGLWYPKDSPFNLVAYSDSDYAGASLDRKSTTGGRQFLCCRLISWQCKKQTIFATSSTEAEYVAATSCCAQAQALIDRKKVIITEDTSRQPLRLDDAAGVDCLPNEEIFAELATMGYEKPSIKLTFYKAQALIDRKKVIITEDTSRQPLRLDDAAGVDCLPNEEIFAELATMGYEKPSIKLTFYKNEFSSSMASAVICLTTRRKFNFSKNIFDSMVRNVDSPSKFLMYPRFLQLMINAQVDDLSSHNTKYTSHAFIQKVLTNMRRNGKGFSRVDTPLFDGMLVQQQVQAVEDAAEDEDDDNKTCATLTKKVANLEQDKIAQAIKITKLKQKVRRRMHPNRGKIADLDADEDVTLVDAEEDMNVNVQGRLAESQAKVVTTVVTTITVAQVPKASTPRKRRGVVIQDPKEIATASVSVHIKVKYKDKDKEILIEEPKPLKRQAQIKYDEAFARQLKVELNENINWDDVMAQERKNMMIYLKNMAGFKMDFFKGMAYSDIRPIFEKHYNSIRAFPEKEEEGVTIQEEGSKRKDDSVNQDVAKKQRIDEEEEELKAHI